MKRYFIIFLTFFTLFNGLVWDKLFKGYREYYMEMIDSLEDDRVRLQLKIDELTNGVRLDGLDVVVTMYHPVRHQTDGTPDILADGTKITIHKASEYNYVAVSRNLLKRWGGWLDFGDFIVLSGTSGTTAKLIFKTLSHCSSDILISKLSFVIPALFTKISIFPCSSITLLTIWLN